MARIVRPVSPLAVRGRADLEAYLGQSLLSEYFERQEGRTRQVATSLKTYMVEAHLAGDGRGLLANAFERVENTGDDLLFRAYDNSGEVYFVDALDPRLPHVHTIGHTNVTDATMAKVTRQPGADRCWLPSRLLLGTQLGRLIGFRFFHQRTVAGLFDSEESRQLAKELGRTSAPPFRMSVSEYAHADRELASLRELLPLGRRAAVDSLSWRTAEGTGSDGFIHDQVWGTGKIAAYGTSWPAHLNNVFLLRDLYRDALELLEDGYAIRDAETGTEGELLNIWFAEPGVVVDPRALMDHICSGQEPFRLVGTYAETSPGRYLGHLVDLHVGDPVTLELSKDALRVHLPAGSCANVLMRLLLNVERHLTAEVATSFDAVLAARA
jgi:hypothetical protein